MAATGQNDLAELHLRIWRGQRLPDSVLHRGDYVAGEDLEGALDTGSAPRLEVQARRFVECRRNPNNANPTAVPNNTSDVGSGISVSLIVIDPPFRW